jgi:hypothetical protein
LFSTLQGRFRFLAVLLLFIVAANDALAGGLTVEACESQGFESAYYLVGVSDAALAGTFFREVVETYESLGGTMGHRYRVETYFDFRGLDLLKKSIELVFSVNENLPEYRPDREKIFYRDNKSPSDVSVYEVKRYNKKISPLDKHPIFGKIKRKERPNLIKALDYVSDEMPEGVVKKLSVDHEEIVYLIRHFGVETGAITLDKFHISNFGIPNTSMLFKIEIYSDAAKKLTPYEKDQLNNFLCHIDFEFRKYLPHILGSSWFGYADYTRMANEMLPGRVLFQKYPVLFYVGQILVLSIIGFFFLYLIIGRYSRHAVFKRTTYASPDKNDG